MIAPSARMMSLASLYPAKTQKTTFSDDGLHCVIKAAENLNPGPPSDAFMTDLARRAYQVGRRDGAATCAFERFDMLMELAYMFVQNTATARERKLAVLRLSSAITEMERHPEARALARIASGEKPTPLAFVHRALQSGRCGTTDNNSPNPIT
jgi:hypothetical protein